MKAIQAQGITKSFGSQRVLNQVSLVVPVGQFVAIIGPNGCGKSTLLKIITGLLSPDQGSVLIFDQNIDQLSNGQLAQCRKNIGLVFQQSPLLSQRDVADNLTLSFECTNIATAEINQRIKETLAMVNLEGYEHKMPWQLSGGERKRVAIACAIIRQPALLLYDEPTSNLDPRNKVLVIELMAKLHHSLSHQTTSVVVSHDPDVLPLVDRILHLQNGQLIEQTKPETRKEVT